MTMYSNTSLQVKKQNNTKYFLFQLSLLMEKEYNCHIANFLKMQMKKEEFQSLFEDRNQ